MTFQDNVKVEGQHTQNAIMAVMQTLNIEKGVHLALPQGCSKELTDHITFRVTKLIDQLITELK